MFVCGVAGVLAPVEPTGTGGSEGAGTVLGLGAVGCVDVVVDGGVGGATCVVTVVGVCVSVEEVVVGVPLDTFVAGAEVTGSVDVVVGVPEDDVPDVSEVEKNMYVALDGGGDEGGGEAAGACVVVVVAGAETAGIPIVSTTVGAFANGSGGVEGCGAAVAFAIVSVTTGTRFTTRRVGI